MRNPKTILITGASSGIGAALAEAYASPGVHLFLHGRNAGRLSAVANLARKRGATLDLRCGDVVDAKEMETWVKACDARQPVDLVIANAGISAGSGGQGETDAQLRAIFSVNLTGVLNTLHPLMDIMIARGRGQMAIVSSLAGFRGFPGAPAYCASKAAVRVYGEALRCDLAGYGVEVNVICPGFIETPMTAVNPFRMPFLMSAERAACIIRRGLELNRARIAFPWAMYAGVRFLSGLPQGLLDLVMGRMPKKPGG